MFFNRLFHFLFGGRLSPFEASKGKRDEGKKITSNSVFFRWVSTNNYLLPLSRVFGLTATTESEQNSLQVPSSRKEKQAQVWYVQSDDRLHNLFIWWNRCYKDTLLQLKFAQNLVLRRLPRAVSGSKRYFVSKTRNMSSISVECIHVITGGKHIVLLSFISNWRNTHCQKPLFKELS